MKTTLKDVDTLQLNAFGVYYIFLDRLFFCFSYFKTETAIKIVPTIINPSDFICIFKALLDRFHSPNFILQILEITIDREINIAQPTDGPRFPAYWLQDQKAQK